jgi:hypothetical protein
MSYRKGVENLPLPKINKHMPIIVYIRDLNAPEENDVVGEYKMDYANYEDRKHLGRLTFWAVTNHHLVETIALADADQPGE